MTDRLFEDPPEARELLTGDGSAVLFTGVLDPDDARRTFATVLDETAWRQHEITLFGRSVREPRLAAWVGEPEATYTYSGLTHSPHAWTPAVASLRERCSELAATTFNSVLVNLYRDGTDSMGWHSDDEPELGPEPTIASMTLGGERRFDLRHRSSGDTIRTVLPSGSVLVMSGACQRHWKHQVPKTAKPVEPRINLTFRHILAAEPTSTSSG